MFVKVWVPALFAALAVNSFAAIKIWDGGGADAYLSTKENWSGDVAPVAGDYLVFAGSTRTSATNDYDPETTTFKMVVFSNNYTTCSAPFTLSGNAIVLTGCVASEYPAFAYGIPAIGVASASGPITDILELDIRLPNSSKLGTYVAKDHHLTFKGTVTGGNGKLQSCDQYASTLMFEGPVKNFSGVERPNGNGVIWLRSAANEFTSTVITHTINQGTLKVDSLEAYGGQLPSILLGQTQWHTPGTFIMNAAQDTRIDGNLTVRGPEYSQTAGTFENAVADTVLTLGGNLSSATTKLGTMVTFGGAGNGVFLGNMTATSTWLNKSGAGTWEFAGGSTSSSTGDVTVSGGTLLLNGDYASMKTTTVKSGATLAGTGTVGNVTFESGSSYRVLADADGVRPLILTGSMTISGSVPVSISAAALANLTAGVEYTLIRYTSKSGVGRFTLGDGFTSSALLSEKADCLVLQLATGEVTWKGDTTHNVWDTTTPNWIGSALYSDGNNASFTDTADTGTTNVTITSVVRPIKVNVTGSRNYTFSGEGIQGPAVIDKSAGTSTLTLNNTNAYTGITLIEAGALVLNGTIADSLVWIDAAAAFTNTASGRLTGSASLVVNGMASLDGDSDFTGGTTIAVTRIDKPLEAPVLVNDPRALGAGDVSVLKGTVAFQKKGGAFGRGRTLTVGASDSVLLYANGVDVTWLGDVEIPKTRLELRPQVATGSWTFGEPGCTTEVRATAAGGIYARTDGNIHWYSRLKLGGGNYSQTDYITSHFHTTGNEWSHLTMQVGVVVCHATNTLAPTRLALGQIYQALTFHPRVDLNGYDQTIAELDMLEVIEGSTQTLKSDMPAMLTISNDTDTVTMRQGGRIEGQVTLRKQGAGNWSFGCLNLSAGDFIVEGGTVTLTASDTLPTASPESRLKILADAKVSVAEGVNAVVPKFSYKDTRFASGVYGGEGCVVPGARIMPTCFAPGAGAVTVTRGDGGFLMMMR